MLSSILRSPRAVQVNIVIMRAFVQMRQLLSGYKELREKIETMERKYDKNLQVVFAAIKELMKTAVHKKEIGWLISQNVIPRKSTLGGAKPILVTGNYFINS